jgi:hypothetical protein
MISDTGKVLYTAATNEHNGVLLEIVSDAGDIRGDFDPVCKADTSDFTQG